VDAPVYLLVALGNPGPEYQFNRHNAGFMVGEELRRRHGLPTLRSKFQGLTAEGTIGGKRVVLLLPTTFMNLSGRAAVVRLKEGQGLGGHNGLRSMQQSFGTRDFWRLRVGVGRPAEPGKPLIDYVLGNFKEPREDVLALLGKAADLAEEWLAGRGDEG
jgi:PTH1 family peptidyl-tRNA hydrolase